MGESMKATTFLVAMVAIASLTSCAPSREDYETLHATLQGSPRLLKKVVKNCQTKSFTRQQIEDFADLMNVDRSRVPAVFCTRLSGGIASGRIAYSDLTALYANRATPNLIKVMQGR